MSNERDAILERLDQIAQDVFRITKAVTTPKPAVWRIIDAIAAVAGAAGIIAIADVVAGWVK